MSERSRPTGNTDENARDDASPNAHAGSTAAKIAKRIADGIVPAEVSPATKAAQPEHAVTIPEVPTTASPGLSRYTEIGRFLMKYRKAGVFKDLAIDDKLAEEASANSPE